MKSFLLGCFMLLSVLASASHLRGGFIQARPLSTTALTYEVTLTLYLDEVVGKEAADDMGSLLLCFGDGNKREVTRQSRTLTTDRTLSINIYRTTYTYAGPGVYPLTASVQTRSISRNITAANQTLMTITTTLPLGNTGLNTTPALAVTPDSFTAATNQPYTLRLTATDAEGDSLIYRLLVPQTATTDNLCNGRAVSTFQYPNDVTRRGTFKVNSRTGVLTWNTPVEQGNYSLALVVDEYRNGVLLSQTQIELSLTVIDRPGTPSPLPPYEPATPDAVVTDLPPYRDEAVRFTVFPNPVENRLQVVIQTSNATTATVRLTDISGRELHRLTFGQTARQHEQQIDMDGLSPGLYLIRADVGGRSLVQKILKK